LTTTPRLKPHPSWPGGEIRSSLLISANNFISFLHSTQAESLKCSSTWQRPVKITKEEKEG